MKHLKLFLLVFVACIICNTVYAQQTDEVTLVVSADGPTKDEATKTALRSAIEQAYGTFVSANTTILNDEMVKDEIVTISSGNIKNYSEVSSNAMPDGKFFVTLKATVSISKLVSYAQSKGAETEFAGATFGMNMKMKELNKQNEKKVIDNMITQLESLSNLFDYKIELFNPKAHGNECIVEGMIWLLYNENTQLYNDILFKTLYSLTLSQNEREEYEQMNIDYYEFQLPYPFHKTDPDNLNVYFDFALRNEIDNLNFVPYVFVSKMSAQHYDYANPRKHKNYFFRSIQNIIISDNISSPTKYEYKISYPNTLKYEYRFSPLTYYKKTLPYLSAFKTLKQCRKIGDKVGYCSVTIRIPLSEVNKISSFKVESKTRIR